MNILNKYNQWNVVCFRYKHKQFHEKIYEIAEVWAFIIVESEEVLRFNFQSKDQLTYQTNWMHPNYIKLIKFK